MDCTNVIRVPWSPFKQVVLPMIVVSDVVGRALELSFLIRKASGMVPLDGIFARSRNGNRSDGLPTFHLVIINRDILAHLNKL